MTYVHYDAIKSAETVAPPAMALPFFQNFRNKRGSISRSYILFQKNIFCWTNSNFHRGSFPFKFFQIIYGRSMFKNIINSFLMSNNIIHLFTPPLYKGCNRDRLQWYDLAVDLLKLYFIFRTTSLVPSTTISCFSLYFEKLVCSCYDNIRNPKILDSRFLYLFIIIFVDPMLWCKD